MSKKLIVIIGPTAVGKTDLSINIAKYFDAPIVSSDSRQIYKEMNIGTAVPTAEQLKEVEHYFIQTRSINEDYTAGKFEKDAIKEITQLFEKHNHILLTGGSGLYIDALCNGIDEVPVASPEVKELIKEQYETNGLECLANQLQILDPEYCKKADLSNHQRVIRALGVCISTGKPYSQLRTGEKKKRDFDIIKVGLTIDRDKLYERINLRVDQMIEQGLENEARGLYEFRELNALQTVGYKEFFEYFAGDTTKEVAIELLKRNTRRYAKRQMTWFRRYDDIEWFNPIDIEKIITYIKNS